MKRITSLVLGSLLLLSCAACGQTGADAPQASAAAYAADTGEAAGSAEDRAAPEDAGILSQPTVSSALDNLNPAPNATVVESQDCYDSAFCFRPEESGTYHFCAQTADSFQGDKLGYNEDTISWTVYVRTEPFEDAWQLLGQTGRPAVSDLTGSTDLVLEAGDYVYCVCSLNAYTGDPAPDGAGALSITPTDTDYAPSADNNYQLAITVNSERQIDLDGDGQAETIYYSVRSGQVGANGVYTASKPASLTVDGTEFLQPSQDNPTSAYGFWMEAPDVEYYYIVDLDADDSYREIAIGDQGSNGQNVTHFFRYSGGQLTYLGQMSSLPDDHTTVFHGDGTVSALTPLNVMQNWSGVRTYELTEGAVLTMVTDEFCAPQLPEGWSVTLLRPLTVYARSDLSAEQYTLQPDASSLSFPLTDGAHWVQVQRSDGTSGWAYFPTISTVDSGGVELDAAQVFGNLLTAG